MSFDATGAIVDSKEHETSNHLNINSNDIDDKEFTDDFFKDDFEPVTQQKAPSENKNGDKVSPDGRDYSMLKLESDQGRVKMEAIDNKLEKEEL